VIERTEGETCSPDSAREGRGEAEEEEGEVRQFGKSRRGEGKGEGRDPAGDWRNQGGLEWKVIWGRREDNGRGMWGVEGGREGGPDGREGGKTRGRG